MMRARTGESHSCREEITPFQVACPAASRYTAPIFERSPLERYRKEE